MLKWQCRELRNIGAVANVLNCPAAITPLSAGLALGQNLRQTRPYFVRLHSENSNLHVVLVARLFEVLIIVCKDIGLPRH